MKGDTYTVHYTARRTVLSLPSSLMVEKEFILNNCKDKGREESTWKARGRADREDSGSGRREDCGKIDYAEY